MSESESKKERKERKEERRPSCDMCGNVGYVVDIAVLGPMRFRPLRKTHGGHARSMTSSAVLLFRGIKNEKTNSLWVSGEVWGFRGR